MSDCSNSECLLVPFMNALSAHTHGSKCSFAKLETELAGFRSLNQVRSGSCEMFRNTVGRAIEEFKSIDSQQGGECCATVYKHARTASYKSRTGVYQSVVQRLSQPSNSMIRMALCPAEREREREREAE